MEGQVKSFLDEMESPGFTVVIFTIALIALWFLQQTLWSYIVLLTLAYNISEVSKFTWAKIRKVYTAPLLPGAKHEATGHAFMFFMFYVIIGAILSSYFSKGLAQEVESIKFPTVFGISIPYAPLILTNFIVVLITYVAFYFTVFREKKKAG
jgi:hypothetical protein